MDPSPQPKIVATQPFVGWREWVSFPELDISRIKAKIDTGARSSALHASNIERFRRNGESMVRFEVCPNQHSRAGVVTVEAPLLEMRSVRSSNGKSQVRPVIRTPVILGDRQWKLELTLTNRDAMGFRMLLGRQALRKRFLIDPGRSYLQGKRP